MNKAGVLASRRLPEGLTGLRVLHELIAAHAEDPDQVVIGIETERGLWVGALVGAGYQVFAVNPLAVARYRDRHHVSGAKSDASDAKLLADLVRTGHNHRPIAGDSADAEAIKVLARAHHKRIERLRELAHQDRDRPGAFLHPTTVGDLANEDELHFAYRAAKQPLRQYGAVGGAARMASATGSAVL